MGNLQPATIVSYDAEIDSVFDCRDEAALVAQRMDASALADAAWRDQMKASGQSATQTFARRLMAAGYHALLVQSFARGATADDLNLVLWTWGDRGPSRLTLIDDENRLLTQRMSSNPPPPQGNFAAARACRTAKEPCAYSGLWFPGL